jgi:adhesin HecA-like repeat protein
LQAWQNLGRAGIEAAGGLDGLAKRDNVSFAALRNYLRADGTLTQQGLHRLNPGGKVEITAAMLRQWVALGRTGIKAAGGLDGLAMQHNVSVATLRHYLRADGTLRSHGENVLNSDGKVEITTAMLRQWATLGPTGLQEAGGLGGLARQHNVSFAALKTYLRADGTLTLQGQDRLDPDGKVEITDDMLRQWAALGRAGIKDAGGLEGLARRNNVSVAVLRNYLRADGSLTQVGEDRLHPEKRAKITPAMLQAWKALGQMGIEAAGGLEGLARQNDVSFAALRNYLRADGTLTLRGEDLLTPGAKVEITAAMLRQWAALGRAGIEAAGGLGGLARRNNVSAVTLRTYLRADGTLSQHGQDRLDPGGKVEITDDMLRQWATLGRAGIEAAGGIDGLARQNNVSAAALRRYLRVDGTLSQYGKDRLTPDGKVEITDDMLRQWAVLGPTGIKAAGGLEGLARRNNVSAGALRHYLHADGTLTRRCEDRLNPGGKAEVTDDMLRQWAALGRAGIKDAGGLDGLARQSNVSYAALRNYLHANGALTRQGEDRLRKADMLPM